MRILMLSPVFPWPLNLGSKIRVYHVLKELARMEHEVTLLALSHEPCNEENLDALGPHCAKFRIVPVENKSRVKAALQALLSDKPYRVVKFESPQFEEEVAKALQEDFDVLWVHFMETLAYIPKSSEGRRKPLIVLDQHNADELLWMAYVRQGPPWVRLFAMLNLWRLRQFQRAVLQDVDIILSVSKEDAEFTRARLPNPFTQVWVVPNGVDTENLKPSSNKRLRDVVIFCGTMDVRMNVDAVEWFARKIFPKVRKSLPNAEFWIVGRDPVPSVKRLASFPGIQVSGRVEDVRPYYAQAKVAVAPFHYGGGTKLKVLEAMALGVPVVATPIGCQGIEAISGKHLFVEQTEEGFAERVIDLLRNETLRERIAIEARRLVEERYSWKNILRDAISRLEHWARKGRPQ